MTAERQSTSSSRVHPCPPLQSCLSFYRLRRSNNTVDRGRSHSNADSEPDPEWVGRVCRNIPSGIRRGYCGVPGGVPYDGTGCRMRTDATPYGGLHSSCCAALDRVCAAIRREFNLQPNVHGQQQGQLRSARQSTDWQPRLRLSLQVATKIGTERS